MAGLPRFPAFLPSLLLLAGTVTATTSAPTSERKDSFAMNRVAESYVKLVLAVGQHDADYVDAYYGPPEWRAEAEAHKRPLPEIRAEAVALIVKISGTAAQAPDKSEGDEIEGLRHAYLLRQLQSMVARIDLVAGKKMTFDQESKALYDAVAPTYGAAHF